MRYDTVESWLCSNIYIVAIPSYSVTHLLSCIMRCSEMLLLSVTYMLILNLLRPEWFCGLIWTCVASWHQDNWTILRSDNSPSIRGRIGLDWIDTELGLWPFFCLAPMPLVLIVICNMKCWVTIQAGGQTFKKISLSQHIYAILPWTEQFWQVERFLIKLIGFIFENA